MKRVSRAGLLIDAYRENSGAVTGRDGGCAAESWLGCVDHLERDAHPDREALAHVRDVPRPADVNDFTFRPACLPLLITPSSPRRRMVTF